MNKTSEEIDSHHQTIIEHLTELRVRLIQSLWGALLGMAICYLYSEKIFDVIRAPIAPYLQGHGLVFTAPMDKFLAHLKLSFFGGLILSCPWWFAQVWKFISPGLYLREKKYAISFVLSGAMLFLVGVLFAYFAAFPAAFQFLMTFGGSVDRPLITIDQYLSFFIWTSLAFGVAFEIPLVLVILGVMGVINQKFLREKRRFSIMILAVIAAIITPPDVLSMTMMLLPMVLLYEISVLIVGIVERRRASSASQI